MARHRHIRINGLGEASASFEPYGGGSQSRPAEIGDRARHAGRLRGDLGRVAQALAGISRAQADIGLAKADLGGAVRIEGRTGQPLDVGTARATGRGALQILNVQRRTSGTGNVQRDGATVFITEKNLASLIDRLDKYESWDAQDATKRRPMGFWLFEGAASFRAATLEDFWTDTYSNFPSVEGAVEWEVWIRDGFEVPFRAALMAQRLSTSGAVTRFVDVSVWNVTATRAQLRRLVNTSAAVVELRGASGFRADDSDLADRTRHGDAEAIARRVRPALASAPRITLLDTGVNRQNPLLRRSLPQSRCHAAEPAWGTSDEDGHGTKMAGVALFGDLADLQAGSGPITLEAALESVVVTAPVGGTPLPARNAIERAVSSVEAESHPRVFCLAATAPGEASDGRPSSTSSTLDQLAFGNAEATRLFCAAVGNVPTSAGSPYAVAQYATLNEDHGIQSPAQALNSLSVGAITNKCSGRPLVATAGDLSPTSRTAIAWEMRRNHKPDIVMEGGNHLIDADGLTSRFHGPNMVLTTSRDVDRRPITVTGETSAATAAAAGLATRLLARYPGMRAETLRGLMAHSAEWSDVMVERQRALVRDGASEQDAWTRILDCYGWGVPNEERLFWSAGNALTLIVEDDLRPYKHDLGKAVTLREMKYFRLPWPRTALAALGAAPVEMRCTLSYFVEPDPHSASRARLDLYPSHKLKFDCQRADETDQQAQGRVNRAVPGGGSGSDDSGWLLGSRHRSRGTLHQDIWRGPAYELADRRGVSVVPNRGWWGDRPDLAPEGKRVRFSLIVSVRSEEVSVELHAEALAQVPAHVLVSVVANPT